MWHSDTSYLEKPPMGTMLIAREVPPYGGDTLFANTYLAYETLSDGMKRMLDGLIAINSSAKADASRTREDRVGHGGRRRQEGVRRRASGRAHPSRDRAQGALCQCRPHRALQGHDRGGERAAALPVPAPDPAGIHLPLPLEVGSIAFWDNRCALHNPVNDYHGYRRVMHRITLAGDTPR